MAAEEYWAHVEAALERLEQEKLHAFAGFDPSEAQECITRSNIIECEAGDRVLKEGGSSHNLFLVLDGALEVRHQGRLRDVLRPGDVFGEMAFLLDLPRQSDVYASGQGARILSLSDRVLDGLMRDDPALASKLLLNISRMLCGRLIKANAARES
jgi:CRP-like cAMP-binding protein